MKCPNCGDTAGNESSFCTACGSHLVADDAPQPVAPVAPLTQAAPSRATSYIGAGLAVLSIIVIIFALNGWLARNSQGAQGTQQVGSTTGGQGGTASKSDSLKLLNAEYGRIKTLSRKVGVARKDGKYGGSGFAYDVFNRLISAKSRSARQSNVKKSKALLNAAKSQRSKFEKRAVDPAYAQQKQSLLNLYDLLTRRMQAMYDAAKVSVNNPAESAWRPVLSPASTQSRVAFEKALPGAKPYAQ